mmetsp:Transcript_37422/g.97003  ORF Transcript_37422/g.97003 Transcript_37422/m.97003 type:complete len:332 (+) Transcript_37422:485-1480(+)
MLALELVKDSEPTGGDAVLADGSPQRDQVLLEQSLAIVQVEGVLAARPSDLAPLRERREELPATILGPEGSVGIGRARREPFDQRLQVVRLLYPDRGAVLEGEVEGFARPQVHELEHGAQQGGSQVFALDRVVADNRGVDIHEDEELLAGGRKSLHDAREVLNVFHGVQDVCLDQDRPVVVAVVDHRVTAGSVALEAVLPLSEVDELACAGIPQVADARTLFVASPLQVVVEEEDPHGLRVGRMYRNDLGMAVGLFGLPPSREARRRNVEAQFLLAHGVVPLDVLPGSHAVVQVDVKDAHVPAERELLHVVLVGIDNDWPLDHLQRILPQH